MAPRHGDHRWAALLARVWSRASAATRHGVWMLAFAALLAAPFARPLIPHWTVIAPVPGVAVPHPAFRAATAQPTETSGARLHPEAASPVARAGAGDTKRGAVVRDVSSERTSRATAGVAVLIWLIGATLLVARSATAGRGASVMR